MTAVSLAPSSSPTGADTVRSRCIRLSAVMPMSAASGLRGSAPEALRFLQERAGLIAAVVAGLVAVALIAVVLARLHTRRELATRVRFAVIPTESFDPSPEEIVRFAAGLSRTRRVVRRVGAKRADAIRLRLLAVAGGQVVQLLEGPKRSLSILRNSGFDQVDLRVPGALPDLFPEPEADPDVCAPSSSPIDPSTSNPSPRPSPSARADRPTSAVAGAIESRS